MAKEKLGTIYGIRFLDDGVFYYVGQTRLPLEKRWAEHRKPNCRAFVSKMLNTFGVEKFTIVVLEQLPFAELNDREVHWIETLGTLAPNGFNRRKGGNVSGMSEATKLRMGEARKKLWADPDYKAWVTVTMRAARAKTEADRQRLTVESDALRAKLARASEKTALTEAERKARASQRAKERGADPELRAKISAGVRESWTDARKAELSETSKSMWADDEYRVRMTERAREQRKALWRDEDYAQRMSENAKAMWDDPAFRELKSAQAKAQWKDPDFRAKKAAHAKEMWADPEMRERLMATRAEAGRKTAEKLRGVPKSPEQKEKQRLAMQERWADPAFRAEAIARNQASAKKAGAAMRGKPKSEEARKRMSEAAKRRCSDPAWRAMASERAKTRAAGKTEIANR